MTIAAVCKKCHFVGVIEKSVTISFLQRQDKTIYLKQNADLTCKYLSEITNKIHFLAKIANRKEHVVHVNMH